MYLFDGRANFGPRAAYYQVHEFRHNGRNRIVKFYLQETILAKCQLHTGTAITSLGFCFGLIKIILCPCSKFNVWVSTWVWRVESSRLAAPSGRNSKSWCWVLVPCASEELQAPAWEKSARHIVGQQLRGMGKGGRAVCMGVFGLSGAWRGSAGGGQHS